jgi:DNA-binding beta-propeller fold protein YncE
MKTLKKSFRLVLTLLLVLLMTSGCDSVSSTEDVDDQKNDKDYESKSIASSISEETEKEYFKAIAGTYFRHDPFYVMSSGDSQYITLSENGEFTYINEYKHKSITGTFETIGNVIEAYNSEGNKVYAANFFSGYQGITHDKELYVKDSADATYVCDLFTLLNTDWGILSFMQNGYVQLWNEDTMEDSYIEYKIEYLNGESQVVLTLDDGTLVPFAYARSAGVLFNEQLGLIQGKLPYGITYAEADLYG